MASGIVKYSLLSFPLASAGLGVWQIKRLEWKTNLIAQLEEKIKQEPKDLLQINSLDELDEYTRIKARGKYDSDPAHQILLKPRQLIVNEEAIFRGRTAHQSSVGVNVITPFSVEGTDLRILVNRGWLSFKGKDSVDKYASYGLPKSDEDPPQEIVGVFRKSDKKSTFGIKNDPSRNEWSIRDVEAIARVLHTAPIFIDADEDPRRTEGPYGGQTRFSIRNEHLNYAITWFSLALLSYFMWYSKYGSRKFFSNFRSQRRR